MTSLKKKPVLLWVEDNSDSEGLQFIPDQAYQEGLELIEAVDTTDCHIILTELEEEGRDVKGIILDILLYGNDSLEDWGLNVSWDSAEEAGFYLLTEVFRDKEKRFHKKLNISDIPILIFTVKPTERKEKYSNYNNVDLIKKYHIGNENWKKDVISWIKKVGR